MQYRVKLVGTLGRYLPKGSIGNVTQVDAQENITIASLVEVLGLPANSPFLVSVNDSLVPVAERESYTLAGTDSIKIIPPLKGG